MFVLFFCFLDCLQLLYSFCMPFRGLSLVFPNFLDKRRGESKAIFTACSFSKYLHWNKFNCYLYAPVGKQSPPVQNRVAFHLCCCFGYLDLGSSLTGPQLRSYIIPLSVSHLTPHPVTAPLQHLSLGRQHSPKTNGVIKIRLYLTGSFCNYIFTASNFYALP